MLKACITAGLAALVTCAPLSVSAQTVEIAWIKRLLTAPPTLSNLEPVPEDLGRAGAEVALAENATTGRFLGQDWTLSQAEIPPGADFAGAVAAALARTPYVILDAPAADVTAAADLPQAAGALLFNSSAPDTALRGVDCRANLLHTLPSRAMLADALMQFLVMRRWTDLVMIEGTLPGDTAWAEALLASAHKFGLEIRARKPWAFDADMRRNASDEVPLFTQDFGDYDLLLVADEINDFARYLPYNTWHPRPVAGSEGLVPAAWSPAVEQWGAAQLQSRFTDATGRAMAPRDYAAWAAVRTLGEAVTRTSSADPATLRDYILGPEFELAGFQGRPLTFRDWDGQLRQPVPLTTRGALVASAPLDGFLHRTNELDSLGTDRPESACSAFGT
ncbi:ABC transporter substrate-binding protein [Salipiger sp.]|uniref:ABC transporter substrate-binding protein n=1 Tax=Salipiger sp. TaxID=2078585 RepID=UPI003A987F16